jgi:diguanylate cyclase
MSENSDNSDNQRWKSKYFDLISTHEQQTAHADELLDCVRRALVRVSLIADNQDIKLDKSLGELRKFLRSQSALTGLSPWVDRVETEYKHYENHQQLQTTALTLAMQKCFEDWKTISLSAQLASQHKLISDGYEELLPSSSGQIQLFNQMVNLSANIIKEMNTRAESPSKGANLLEKTIQTPAASTTPESTQHSTSLNCHVPPISQSEGFFASLFNKTSTKEPVYSAVSVEIRRILQRLVSQIKVPNAQQKKYISIDEKINEGLNWYELVPTLDDVADLVLLALGNTQDEFEQFLKNLNKELSGVYQQLSKTAGQQIKQREVSKNYDQQLRQTVSSIQGVVLDAQNIDDLKTTINTQVLSLFDLISERRAQECLNEQTLEDEIAIMESKIARMEQESEKIKSDIINQHKLTMTDFLTQLPNRQAYQEWLTKELPRIQRYNTDVTLVIADVDHFKQVNDRYGHLAGDKVLQILAKTLKDNVRESDFIGRFGGEEFIILMPETTGQQALQVAEKLRMLVGKCPFHFNSEPVSIYMSFGIAQLKRNESEVEAFERADKGLYQAKAKGRNCSVLMKN